MQLYRLCPRVSARYLSDIVFGRTKPSQLHQTPTSKRKSTKSGMEGLLHIYHPTRRLLLFEHTPRPSTSQPQAQPQSTIPSPPQNTLLFVGGMYDNFLDPSYTCDLASLFPRHARQTWSLMHLQLSSAGRAFGTSSLDKDIEEMAVAINYIRSQLRPPPMPATTDTSKSSSSSSIVLLGHSTGCQDVLHYLYKPNPLTPRKPARPTVQGAILQAPCSDRDGAMHSISSNPEHRKLYDEITRLIQATPESQHRSIILPLNLTTPFFGPAPLSISRFLSLMSPSSPSNPGDDDLFSSDGTDDHLKSTFGAVGNNGLLALISARKTTNTTTTTISDTPATILALHGSDDEFIPEQVDKHALLQRWRQAMHTATATATATATSTNPPQRASHLHEESGIITHANHAISGDEPPQLKARLVDFRTRVLKYIDDVVGGVDETAWAILERDRRAVEAKLDDASGGPSPKRSPSGSGNGNGNGNGNASPAEKSDEAGLVKVAGGLKL